MNVDIVFFGVLKGHVRVIKEASERMRLQL